MIRRPHRLVGAVSMARGPLLARPASPPVRRVVLPNQRPRVGVGMIPAGELCRPVPPPCGKRLLGGGLLGHFPGPDGRCIYGCEDR